MKKSHALSLVLFTLVATPGISTARDLLDAPGPGYRQQAERVSLVAVDAHAPRIRVELPSLLSPSPFRALPDFSEPIRLSLPALPLRGPHFWEVPAQVTPKKSP